MDSVAPPSELTIAMQRTSQRLLWLITLLGDLYPGQTIATAQAPNPPVAGASHTALVSGRVLNALTGAPVGRALVTLNTRAVLTDALGRFSFPEFDGTQAFLQVTKPGYSQTPDPQDGRYQQALTDLATPVDLKLYPDAVLFGTVNSREGLPLPNVTLTLARAVFDATGAHALPTATSTTNSHGEYRFVQPEGQYRLKTNFIAKRTDTGKQYLPVSVPENTEGNTTTFLTLHTGQQERVDLILPSGSPVPLLLRLEPKNLTNLRVSVVSASGEAFLLATPATDVPGQYRGELPVGSYTLHLHSDQGQQALDGSAHINVTSSQAPIQLELAPASSLPIELSIEQTGAASNVREQTTNGRQTLNQQEPTAVSLNLSLQSLTSDLDALFGATLSLRQDHGFYFSVPPGRYRLRSLGQGLWHVSSAAYGTSNLLQDDLVVGSGSVEPIRLGVSNRRGEVSGRVGLEAFGAAVWVYFVPQTPSLTAFYVVKTSPQGTFRTFLPAGTYTVVVAERRPRADLTDPTARNRFVATGKSIEINDGASVAIDLTLPPPVAEP